MRALFIKRLNKMQTHATISIEERLEMKAKVKPLNDELISLLVKRILIPAYKRYLEQEEKDKKLE